MAQDITASIDSSAILDGQTANDADVLTAINNFITVINAMLNGGQAFDRMLFEAAETLTIASGVLSAPTKALVIVAAESGTADDLVTITASNNRFAVFWADTGDTITFKHVSGNINLNGGDIALTGNAFAIGFCRGGQWTLVSSLSAPTDAKYIVQTAHTGLSAEQALSTLQSGRVTVATTTGVLSSHKDTLSGSLRPGSAFDSNSLNYSVGSIYIDANNERVYMATDVSTGAAIWVRLDDTYDNHFEVRASAAAALGVGVANPTTANSPANANASEGTFMTLPTTASSGNIGGIVSTTFNLVRRNHDFEIEIVVKTDSDITTQRLWIGLCEADVTNVDSLAAAGTEFAGFRFSTVAGDVGWTPITCDGTTQNAGTTIGTVSADTFYRLRIRKPVGVTALYFSVNNSAEQVVSSNLPQLTTDLGFCVRCITTSAAIRRLLFSRLRVMYT